MLTKELLKKESINAAVNQFFRSSEHQKNDGLSEDDLEEYCRTTVEKFHTMLEKQGLSEDKKKQI